VPPKDARESLATTNDADVAFARDIGWAVTRAAGHVPFGAVCLPQAIAAQRMLKRHGIACIV
jgi:hypothetical protein